MLMYRTLPVKGL